MITPLNYLLQFNPYFFSLIITFVTEGLVVLFITRKLRLFSLSILINLITHPWAYYLFVNHLSIIIVEGMVIIVEIIAWSLLTKNRKKAILLSLSTNILSGFVGFLLTIKV